MSFRPPINLFSVKGGIGATTLAAVLHRELAHPSHRLGRVRTVTPDMRDMAAIFAQSVGGYTNNDRTLNYAFDGVLTTITAQHTPPAHDECDIAEGYGRPLPGFYNVLLVKPCYLALSKIVRERDSWEAPLDAHIVIEEDGRPLRAADVTHVLGTRCIANMMWNPAIGRIIDAGLLMSPQYTHYDLNVARFIIEEAECHVTR